MPEFPRPALPRPGGPLFLSDSSLETWLSFEKGVDLPEFAAFPLIETDQGRAMLGEHWQRHIAIAMEHGTGLILGTPTWRASADWGARLGYDAGALDRINQACVMFLQAIRADAGVDIPLPISGQLGPKGDGYFPETLLTPEEAEAYHSAQIASFAAAGADMVTAMTLPHSGEATGIARAAAEAGLPCVIAFTTETDGRLPSGQSLGEAIETIDAATAASPLYYMINCAHPDHFERVLDPDAPWIGRLAGLRANASRLSHTELDNAETLDDGDPSELGRLYAALRERLPALSVLGGCCGTDTRHLEHVCEACA